MTVRCQPKRMEIIEARCIDAVADLAKMPIVLFCIGVYGEYA